MVNTIKSPEEVLYNVNLFSVQNVRPISLVTPKFEFLNQEQNIKDKIERARWLFEQALKADPNNANKESLERQFERLAANFVYNCLQEDFISEYGEELCAHSSAADRLKFVSDIFGDESEAEKKRRNKIKFESLARRTDKNEKFSSFLSKLRSLASDICDNNGAKDYIVDDQFRKSLSPEVQKFLRDNCILNESPDNISKFLDDRQRYITEPKINQIEINSKLEKILSTTSNLIAKSNISVEEKLSLIEKNNRDAQSKLLNQIESLTATISKMEVANSRSRQNAAPGINASTTDFRAQFAAPQTGGGRSFPSQNGFTRRPRFCNYCKVDTHYRSNCPFVTCHSCQLKGHMQWNCPTRQQRNPAQDIQPVQPVQSIQPGQPAQNMPQISANSQARPGNINQPLN
jgi:hypothetical protein